MADIAERQYAVGGLVFGEGLPLLVTSFDPGGKPATANQDTPVPGADGQWFGTDTLPGRVLTWEGNTDCDTAADAWAAYAALAAVWDDPGLRLTPNAVTQLSLRLPGSAAVCVYGRPRQCAPALTASAGQNGTIPWSADFQTADRLFYSSAERSATVGLIPPTGGGVTWPVSWPTSWAAPTTAPGRITVGGNAATWPVVRFTGPITGSLVSPQVAYPNAGLALTLGATILPGQWAEIDLRPWARTVLGSSGGSLAGDLSGSPMDAFALNPGETVVAFHGADASGTSQMTFSWRDASTTPYQEG